MPRFSLATVRERVRGAARRVAEKYGGLPHSVGTVDSPPPPVAGDVTALWIRNMRSRTPIIDPAGDEVVTMTTHGKRLSDVWLAIESIGRGEVLPRRMILWLDGPELRLPWRLRRLRRRGLEVIHVPAGMGVHTKYWHYLTTQEIDRPLVTSDDDILYPPDWLSGLRAQHRRHPHDVIAYRAHRVGVVEAESFAPYSQWLPASGTDPSFANFATSVSGQLLPADLQRAIVADGNAFLAAAPTADDVWLHRCAVAAGYRTRLVQDESRHWWFIPGSQTTGLNAINVQGGANDRQLEASHTAQTRERIRADLEIDGAPRRAPTEDTSRASD